MSMSNRKLIQRFNDRWNIISRCFIIPQRIILSMMCLMGVTCLYAMKGTEAIVLPIVIHRNDEDEYESIRITNKTILCSELPDKDRPLKDVKLVIIDLFYWDDEQMEIIKKSYYWSLLIAEVPAAILAIHTGGKHVLAISFLVQALCMLCVPSVLINFNWMGLLLLKIMRGLTKGAIFSGIYVLFSHWIPRTERSFNFPLIFFGIPFGTFIGKITAEKMLKDTQNWKAPFYIFGTLSFLWCVLWQMLCYSYPEKHPFIKEKELNYLQENNDSRKLKLRDIQWRGLITKLPVWAFFVGRSGHNWIVNSLYAELPKYLRNVLKYNYSVVFVMPWFCLGLSGMAFGAVADCLIRHRFGTATIRKFYSGLAGLGGMFCLLTVPFCGCSEFCTMTLFCLEMGFLGLFESSIGVNSFDLTPNFASILEAITKLLNFVCNWLINLISPPIPVNHTLEDWRSYFWLVLLIEVTTSLIFIIWGSGDVQDFDRQGYTFTSLRKKNDEYSDEKKQEANKMT